MHDGDLRLMNSKASSDDIRENSEAPLDVLHVVGSSAQGVEGLLEGYRSGRPARLSAAQHRRLGDILDSGPVAYGLDTGIWTSPMIAWVVEEEFGVVYHPGHVRKLLHDLGFSVQRPRRVLARADRHQQDRWHRYLYPRLKKKPAPRTGR